MENNITQLNIKKLFSEDEYLIPIYQRNYAWGETEIDQLIQDIVDSLLKNDNSAMYYLGSLIVDEPKDGKFETIDGQQRLTTLFIILCALKNEILKQEDCFAWFKFNLSFSSRKKSTETLEAIFKHNYKELVGDYTSEIIKASEISTKSIKKILNEVNLSPERFYTYFLEKVVILRIPVPPDTDLNHYFEIMNSRGEQLEKHEILKAKCLGVLKDEKEKSSRYAFNLIWEACANMEKYVQYGFSVGQRSILFGEDLNILPIDKEVLSKLQEAKAIPDPNNDSNQEIAISLKKLINPKNKNQTFNNPTNKKDEDSPDRFNSIINFPNFLLHVLRLQTGKDIALDDKQLLKIFDDQKIDVDFVEKFGLNLLKTKFLFDKYIIKKEFTKDGDKWSLKRLKIYNDNKINFTNTFGLDENENSIDLNSQAENKNLIMLLSMFHVSFPTQVYKYWLNAALKFIFEKEGEFKPLEFIEYLEKLGEAYLKNRFLAKDRKSYEEIIYTNNGIYIESEIIELKLDQGTDVENFIFNYLDYLLWKKYKDELMTEFKEFKNFKDFEFTFRSSVEHYYPQNPKGENQPLEEIILNNFGNLCLISRSKNSELSNYLPNAKKEHYNNLSKVDSIKQRVMMKKDSWGKNEIKEHGAEMKKILFEKKVQTDENL